VFLHTFGPGITDLAGLSERRTPQTRGSAKFSKRIDRIDSTTTAVDYLLIYTDDKTFPEPFFPRYRRVFFFKQEAVHRRLTFINYTCFRKYITRWTCPPCTSYSSTIQMVTVPLVQPSYRPIRIHYTTTTVELTGRELAHRNRTAVARGIS
jgi:hypothetical protein